KQVVVQVEAEAAGLERGDVMAFPGEKKGRQPDTCSHVEDAPSRKWNAVKQRQRDPHLAGIGADLAVNDAGVGVRACDAPVDALGRFDTGEKRRKAIVLRRHAAHRVTAWL